MSVYIYIHIKKDVELFMCQASKCYMMIQISYDRSYQDETIFF